MHELRVDEGSVKREDRPRSEGQTSSGPDERARRRYEAPRVTKKRSVARVTLFSGGGTTAGGLTATG